MNDMTITAGERAADDDRWRRQRTVTAAVANAPLATASVTPQAASRRRFSQAARPCAPMPESRSRQPAAPAAKPPTPKGPHAVIALARADSAPIARAKDRWSPPSRISAASAMSRRRGTLVPSWLRSKAARSNGFHSPRPRRSSCVMSGSARYRPGREPATDSRRLTVSLRGSRCSPRRPRPKAATCAAPRIAI
jgi:hypothetical protein